MEEVRMAHPLVDQVRFARREFRRALAGVGPAEATKRPLPMNSLGWIICHLAGHERRCWLIWGQGITDRAAVLDEWGRYGKPATTPPLAEAWAVWEEVTAAADPYLDSLTEERLLDHLVVRGKPLDESIGTMLLRLIYHYWYHTGEASAVRQMLGHPDLPEFVGDLGGEAPYRAS
jgi:hypothetical protein